MTISTNTLKEDLKKEVSINFSGLNSKNHHANSKKLILNKKYSEELDASINENNHSADMVIINQNKEISLRKTPLQIRNSNIEPIEKYANHGKSANKQQKNNKTIATALLCEKCEETYQPQKFLEHLKYCHNLKEDNSMPNSNRKNITGADSNYFSNIFQNNEVSNLNEKYFSVPHVSENKEESHFYNNNSNNSFIKSKTGSKNQIVNILDGLNKEKTDIIYQLKNVEEKLQKTQIDNQIIYEEKENLQADLQSLLNELQNTKLQMAYSAEEKQQAENLLKKEIKILIKKLIKTKGKLIDQKNSSKLEGTNSSLVNLSGFINFYNQNKDNSTFGNKTIETQNNADSSFLNQSIQQVFSNSLFSLANKSSNHTNNNINVRNKSKSNFINVVPVDKNNYNCQKTPKNSKEIYCTPNKNEMENIYNYNDKLDKVKKNNFQLFKGKFNESTAKQSKKANRYNN